MYSKVQLAHMILVYYLFIKHITQLIFILIRILHSLYWLFHCWENLVAIWTNNFIVFNIENLVSFIQSYRGIFTIFCIAGSLF